jgi:hypothetical protein
LIVVGHFLPEVALCSFYRRGAKPG